MNTETQQITVSGLPVRVVRKNIKNLHLGVYPPHGRVRVAAPLRVSENAVRLAIVSKLGWIKRQRARFESQARQSAREMVSGEAHYFLGRRYRLHVIHGAGLAGVILRNRNAMELYVTAEASAAQRQKCMQNWYRRQLKEMIPQLLQKWQPVLGVQVNDWCIKKMKTKWGSCNAVARRIWVNLELAKKPVQCLEYIVVHELVHLIERRHNERFINILDKHMPQWQSHRQELNSEPLSHETWTY